ncbi:MAG: c-type cytochrome [Kiritimatiellales bacterium]
MSVRKIILFSFISASVCGPLSGAAGEEYLSPSDMALTDGGRKLLVTQHTGKRLDLFDIQTQKIVRSISLPDEPRGLACSADGGTAYVVTGEGAGILRVLDVNSGKIIRKIPVGHGPMAPVLSPDGKKLYVCNRFDNAVGIIDLSRNKQVGSVPVVREPVAAALTPDGSLLLAANHLPSGPANVDYVASEVSVIDTAKGELIKNIKLVNGSEGLRGICISADGKYAYVTHLTARYQLPVTQLERGWINTDALSVIRIADLKLLYTVLLDDVNQGFANPWGVAVSADGRTLCVVSAGNHELSVINLEALHAKIETAAAGGTDTYDDLSMLAGVRQRIPLKGTGPRNVLLHGDTLYIAEYFSDSLGMARLQGGAARPAESIPLGPVLPLTPSRRGEILFNDAGICFQNWLSCASCHPDARMDSLNWDLLNDGIGNPKNAKSLLFSHVTPPVMSLGVRDSARTAVRTGIRYTLFAVRPEEEAAAIDDYLINLKPAPSPYLVNGKLSKAARRGKKLFEQAGCARCHPAPLYTDLKSYDVGTGTGMDAGKLFDAPTLREIWRTAPYLHDGSAATLKEVITVHNPQDRRGHTSNLTPEQVADLVEFLNSL